VLSPAWQKFGEEDEEGLLLVVPTGGVVCLCLFFLADCSCFLIIWRLF
jgi:hypothetical protein